MLSAITVPESIFLFHLPSNDFASQNSYSHDGMRIRFLI